MTALRSAVFLQILAEKQLLEPGQLQAVRRLLRGAAAGLGTAPVPLADGPSGQLAAPGPGQGTAVRPHRVLDLLGEGGRGRAFKAYRPKLDRQVALKVLRKTCGRTKPRWPPCRPPLPRGHSPNRSRNLEAKPKPQPQAATGAEA